jgi:hypothetical protein
VAAGHPDVLVQRMVAVELRGRGGHDAVRRRVDARRRQWRRRVQDLRAHVRDVGYGSHRVSEVAIQRAHEQRHTDAARGHAHRAAERDHAADAFRRRVSRVERVDAAEAPADQADLATVLMMQVTHLLLERESELALEAGVLAEAPGLDVVAARLQEQPQADQRRVRGREPRDQQDGVAIAARRRAPQQRQQRRQQPHFEQRTRFDQRVQKRRRCVEVVGVGQGLRVRSPVLMRCSKLSRGRSRLKAGWSTVRLRPARLLGTLSRFRAASRRPFGVP